MATPEYETTSQPETHIPAFEDFKAGLELMVTDVESAGDSALKNLSKIRLELRAKSVDLIRQSSIVEQQIRDNPGNYDQNSMYELARFQEELIAIYHQQRWLEGYILDPLN